MGEIFIYVLLVIAGGAIGGLITATVLRKAVTKKSEVLLEEAKEKAEVIKKEKILQAKEKFIQLKSDHERMLSEKNREMQKAESKLQNREQQFTQKWTIINVNSEI